jgi:hypothetical protein
MHMDRLNRGSLLAAAVAAIFVFVGHAQAKPIAYPAKGQSAKQQKKDDGECYVWAKGNTGIDPAAVAAAPPPPSGPAVGGGERARGALRGAAVGGIVGGSEGAGKGAAVGVVVGGVKARRNQKAQQEAAQAQKQGAIDTFNRAYAACMEGRGYTIK